MTWGVDDYPGSAAPDINGYDHWGYAWRNCTSFAMHRVVDDLHDAPRYWGNGGSWGDNARAQHLSVDGTPRPGDIFSIPPNTAGVGIFGHCGAVLQVDLGRGIFLAEDYNWKPLAYEQHWLNVDRVSFIHLGGAVPAAAVTSQGGQLVAETHPMDPNFAAQIIVALIFGRGMGADTYNAIAADVESMGQLQALYKWAGVASANGEIALLDRVENLKTDFKHTAQHTHAPNQVVG